jgi:Fe2+ transport system protein FeoA
MHIGQTARIVTIKAKGDIRRRLLDIGLIKDVQFNIMRVAPLGDPIEICASNMLITLRKKEAQTILVQPIEP